VPNTPKLPLPSKTTNSPSRISTSKFSIRKTKSVNQLRKMKDSNMKCNRLKKCPHPNCNKPNRNLKLYSKHNNRKTPHSSKPIPLSSKPTLHYPKTTTPSTKKSSNSKPTLPSPNNKLKPSPIKQQNNSN
jgi:hypothetical protein